MAALNFHPCERDRRSGSRRDRSTPRILLLCGESLLQAAAACLSLDAQLFELAVERRKAQSQEFGGSPLVAGALIQGPLDMDFFEKIERRAEIVFAIGLVVIAPLPGQVGRLDP